MNPNLNHSNSEWNRSLTYSWSHPSSITGLILKLLALVLIVVSCNTSQEFVPKAKQLVPQKTFSFNVGEVKLLNGPFKESQDAEAKYLLSLNLDCLLAPFRAEGGLEAKAKSYPGWEISLPGVALSFYLSGTSRLYLLTGEEIYRKNINYILDELALCQSRNDGFLLGGTGVKKVLERFEKEGYYEDWAWGRGYGEPFYCLEKLYSGLIDVYRICNNPKALKILIDLTDWLDRHISHFSDNDMQKIMRVEYGGMNWVLSDMYVITGNKKYLAMSKRWHDNEIIVPMTKGIDVLTKKHGNTQFPKMSGLAARYPYTADSSDLKGATFFWESVVNHRTYVTGGNTESEFFRSRDSLSNALTPYTAENCNEYNMLKLTSLLYKIEPRVEYADYMERTLYNHILSAQNPEDGRVCYHLPLMPGAERFYRPLFEEFSCCVCSAMDSYTRHSEYIYAHTKTELYVNLFIPSELNWKKKGITIRQKTEFPFSNTSSFSFKCKRESEIGVNIRNPFWLSEPMTLKINGEVQMLNPSNGYYHIMRKWNTGDIVEINLPMNIRYESMPDDKNKMAFFYGPVLLAGAIDKNAAIALVKDNVAPALVPGDKPFDQWFKLTGTPLEYTTTIAKPVEINLKPFFKLKTGAFTVYWQKVTDKEFHERIVQEKKQADNIVKLERFTMDKVLVGNEDSERNHELTGTSNTGKGNYGIMMDETWRCAEPAFSYKMAVSGDEPISLLCKFMGRYQHEKWNCKIKIDTTVIALLKRGKDDSYPVIPFYYCFSVPNKLTKGKNAIQVKFEIKGEKLMPRLMELRILKKNDYPIYPELIF
jgi:uncharacterized protein